MQFWHAGASYLMATLSLLFLTSCVDMESVRKSLNKELAPSLSANLDKRYATMATAASTIPYHLKAAESANSKCDRGLLFNETDAILSVPNSDLINLPQYEWQKLETRLTSLGFDHFVHARIDKPHYGLQSEPSHVVLPAEVLGGDVVLLELVYAEKLYRKVLTVEAARGSDWPELVRHTQKDLADCLRQQGRETEAASIEQEMGAQLEADLNRNMKWWKRADLLTEQAKEFDEANNPVAAEKNLKEAVKLTEENEDLSPARIAEFMADNSKHPHGGVRVLHICGALSSLAHHYNRNHQYDLEEATLLKELAWHQKICPPTSFLIKDNKQRIQTCQINKVRSSTPKL